MATNPVRRIFDRLTNVMSGMGTTVDRSTGRIYVFNPISAQQAEAAYRSSWLVRKIIDIPAKDMTRAWRDWQADEKQIEALEKEERRLQLRDKVKRALVLSRLFGGAGLILGTTDPDPMQPLNPATIKAGGLTYVHAMAPHQFSTGEIILDPADQWFGKPSYFQINTNNGQVIKLHPSRVVDFVGQRAPEGAFHHTTTGSTFWGDPIMQSVGDAVKNADTAQAGFAALIDEAKLDIIKIPDLMDLAGSDEGETRLIQRLQLAATGKSTWRALLMDADEEWEQRQVNWAGIPDVMRSFLEVVSGAADIPITRFLGQSPKGLQSTGDGEVRDYQDKVKADQHEILTPALDRIDDVLIPSALGSRPAEVYFEFAPLSEPDEKDIGAIEKEAAETLKIYGDAGILPDQAITDIAKNRMIETGRWPGAEAAFAKAPAYPDPSQGAANDPAAIAAVQTKAETAQAMTKAGKITADQATMLMADATPRPLYVQRKLVNTKEFLDWAKAQGFGETLPADELHVTLLYSRQPVDWMQAEAAWNQNDNGQVLVPPGGVRIVEALGDKGAVVLLFGSSDLCWRHEQLMRSLNASHDFESYQPHVTITYAAPADLDLDKVEPYRGKLLFGPEIFEDLGTEQASGGGPAAATPFDGSDAYNPAEPRVHGGPKRGQWTKGGPAAAILAAEQEAENAAEAEAAQLLPFKANKEAMLAKNAGKDLAQVVKEGHANQASLRAIGSKIESEHGIQFVEPMAGHEVKSAASIARKVADEGYSGPDRLTDVSRATLVVKSPAEADLAVSALRANATGSTLYDKGWKQLDRSGYLDRKLILQHPNGGMSEIQVVPAGVQSYKSGQGHKLYEIERNPSVPLTAASAAARKMRTQYDKAIRADGFQEVIPHG